MVTFSCDNCNDTVKKPKANQHAQRCRGSLTCIDCSKTFWSGEWNVHNACISEAEAYQGALYKPTKKELKRKAAEQAAEQAQATNLVVENPPSTVVASAKEILHETVQSNEKDKKSKRSKTTNDTEHELLTSVVPLEGQISIHKALKLLKSQKMIEQDADKNFLKKLLISRSADGTLHLKKN